MFCGAEDLIRRDWNTLHEKDAKQHPGQAAPGDGRLFVARPPSDPPPDESNRAEAT